MATIRFDGGVELAVSDEALFVVDRWEGELGRGKESTLRAVRVSALQLKPGDVLTVRGVCHGEPVFDDAGIADAVEAEIDRELG